MKHALCVSEMRVCEKKCICENDFVCVAECMREIVHVRDLCERETACVRGLFVRLHVRGCV